MPTTELPGPIVTTDRGALTAGSRRATIEHMFLQGSLFGTLEPAIDTQFATVSRIALDDASWVDHAPAWLHGDDRVFDELFESMPWRQKRGVVMYDSVVDEPRLTAWWSRAAATPEPLPVLGEARQALGDRYSTNFDSIGFNLYRDGRDSVAWHGDRHRHTLVDPIVAILSVGAGRSFRLRRRGAGGGSHRWALGHGDLLVMGGACQHEWEHSVPKTSAVVGPRMSITFRHGAR
jgi:alkylated DNA repair dioxygenase AlkB